ncbi:MAG: hypothetical protein IPP90_02620 [Gemmatimonadaceae bacterium]|nr:hypothetical protein [Gemmatimonadaceae bacterium]
MLPISRSFALAASILVCLTATPAHSQTLPSNLPTPQQAEAMLRARPELAAQLRQRLQSSGLSPVQVRTRLRAAGYPESLLDQVMGAATTSEASRVSADSLIGALRSLGVVDSTDATALRRMAISSAANTERAASRPLAGDDSAAARAVARRGAGETDYNHDGSTLFGLDLFL